MLWSLIYEVVFSSASKADKLQMLGQIIGEYAQHVMNITAALITDDNGTRTLSEEAQQERKQIEAGIVNPFFTKARKFLKAGDPLAGLTFQEHSQLTLAVSKEYSNRLVDIVLTRLKEGRKISTATLNRMRSWHDSLVEMANDLGDLIGEVDPDSDTEKGALQGENVETEVKEVNSSPEVSSDPATEQTTQTSTPEPTQIVPQSESPEIILGQGQVSAQEAGTQQAIEQLRMKALQQRAMIARDALHHYHSAE